MSDGKALERLQSGSCRKLCRSWAAPPIHPCLLQGFLATIGRRGLKSFTRTRFTFTLSHVRTR